jgi:hypothetical protein
VRNHVGVGSEVFHGFCSVEGVLQSGQGRTVAYQPSLCVLPPILRFFHAEAVKRLQCDRKIALICSVESVALLYISSCPIPTTIRSCRSLLSGSCFAEKEERSARRRGRAEGSSVCFVALLLLLLRSYDLAMLMRSLSTREKATPPTVPCSILLCLLRLVEGCIAARWRGQVVCQSVLSAATTRLPAARFLYFDGTLGIDAKGFPT